MRSQKKFTVACLSGDGIGPELMAEASRALAEAGRLHRFRVEEVHVPFAGEAVSRYGHPLPAETRAACRRADAVLVALTKEPALEGVKSELDLTWRVQRVRLPDGDIAVVSPLDDQLEPYVVRRAFDLARSRKAKVAAVGDGPTWSTFVGWEADRHPGVEVERLSLSEALPRLMNAPDGFCVVVTQKAHAELVSDLTAASRNDSRIVASGRLSAIRPRHLRPHARLGSGHRRAGRRQPERDAARGRADALGRARRAGGRANTGACGLDRPGLRRPHRRPRRQRPGRDHPRLHGRRARADADHQDGRGVRRR